METMAILNTMEQQCTKMNRINNNWTMKNSLRNEMVHSTEQITRTNRTANETTTIYELSLMNA